MTQQQALKILKMGYNVFLTGPPGSGKTFLLQKYIDFLRKQGKRVAVTASTGIAATHIEGRTIHSWSGLGIKENLTEQNLVQLLRKRYLKKNFKDTKVLIIDEVSMLHPFQFDLLNRICQAFNNSFHPFGGMQVVCSGDFFQLPPVQKQGTANFITQSRAWSDMDIKTCYLTEQHRQQQSGPLLKLLSAIRRNQPGQAREMLLSHNWAQASFAIAPARLYTHNVDVEAMNQAQLARIKAKKFVYLMRAEGVKNIVEALKAGCLASERLALKKDAKVMFIKNNFNEGYVNGTLGRVVGFNQDKLPVVKTFQGRSITVKPASWTIEEAGEIKAELTQLPLRLAWAITVHKSQGMNLDAAEINLSKSFIKGMGYVALSRLCSLQGLKLTGLNNTALLVAESALQLDRHLKGQSQRTVDFLEAMPLQEKREKQKRFLASLPQIEKSAPKEPSISTYEKTRRLLQQGQPSLEKIAKARGLKQETIISHLEQLLEQREKEIDINWLRPQKDRFQKIKLAFSKTDDWTLSPVKEILGDDFSYREIRLARLFLKQGE